MYVLRAAAIHQQDIHVVLRKPLPPLAAHSNKHIVHSALWASLTQPHAIRDRFRNKGESRTFCLPPTSCFPSSLPLHTQNTRKPPCTNALPSGDEGRCAQAPPLFPKTHGMQLRSLCYVTQHQWDDASLLTTLYPLLSPPTLCSVSLFHTHSPSSTSLMLCCRKQATEEVSLFCRWSVTLQKRKTLATCVAVLSFNTHICCTDAVNGSDL